MAAHVAKKVIQHIIQMNGDVKHAKVLVMGATFKENVSDIRNSKVADVIKELKSYFLNVHVTDPHADSGQLQNEYGFSLTDKLADDYDAVIVAVPHSAYIDMENADFCKITKDTAMVADLKGIFRNKLTERKYWSL